MVIYFFCLLISLGFSLHWVSSYRLCCMHQQSRMHKSTISKSPFKLIMNLYDETPLNWWKIPALVCANARIYRHRIGISVQTLCCSHLYINLCSFILIILSSSNATFSIYVEGPIFKICYSQVFIKYSEKKKKKTHTFAWWSLKSYKTNVLTGNKSGRMLLFFIVVCF